MKTSYPLRAEIVRGLVFGVIWALISLLTFDSGRPKWAAFAGVAFFAGWVLLGTLPRYLIWRKSQ